MNQLKALFSIGFRPFFLLASLLAILNPTFWISSMFGYSELGIQVTPLFWHGHEMLFGFSEALLGGFLLTASANWTGKEPYRGNVLILLASLWLIERVSFFLPISDEILLIVSNVFLPVLIVFLFFTLKDSAKQKYVFIPILTGFFICKVLHSYGYLFAHEDLENWGLQTAVSVIRLVVLLIAGRVLPFFTRKRLEGVNIEVPSIATKMAMIPVLLLCLPFPPGTPKVILIIIFLWAILGNLYRNYLLFDRRVLGVPLLYVLHLGINFLLLGMVFGLIEVLNENFNQYQEVLHATMAGGLGIISIGIMTRVSLGHTGRKIRADRWAVTAYACVLIGASIRVCIPHLFEDLYLPSLHYASGFWTTGFIIFFFRHFKVLTGPRPDGKI